MVSYFRSKEQDTESEDCGHLDDREQQTVGFHDTLRLLLDSPLPFAVLILPFKDGYQRRGNQEHQSPKKQEVCSRRKERIGNEQVSFCRHNSNFDWI